MWVVRVDHVTLFLCWNKNERVIEKFLNESSPTSSCNGDGPVRGFGRLVKVQFFFFFRMSVKFTGRVRVNPSGQKRGTRLDVFLGRQYEGGRTNSDSGGDRPIRKTEWTRVGLFPLPRSQKWTVFDNVLLIQERPWPTVVYGWGGDSSWHSLTYRHRGGLRIQLRDGVLHYHNLPPQKLSINPDLLEYSHLGSAYPIHGNVLSTLSNGEERRETVHSCVLPPSDVGSSVGRGIGFLRPWANSLRSDVFILFI